MHKKTIPKLNITILLYFTILWVRNSCRVQLGNSSAHHITWVDSVVLLWQMGCFGKTASSTYLHLDRDGWKVGLSWDYQLEHLHVVFPGWLSQGSWTSYLLSASHGTRVPKEEKSFLALKSWVQKVAQHHFQYSPLVKQSHRSPSIREQT